jgi:hypothetical protein
MKVVMPFLGKETLMSMKRRKRHNPEQFVRKLWDDAMLNAGKDQGRESASWRVTQVQIPNRTSQQ